MKFIQPEAFEFAMSKIEDGFLFEKFAQDLLSQILGQEFVSAGGVKDRAIDGLEHILSPRGVEKKIYQTSIEKDAVAKIKRTIRALKKYNLIFDRLIYVTNQSVENKDVIVENLYDEEHVNVSINDLSWLRGRVNTSEGTIRTYHALIETRMHEYIKPGMSMDLTDLEADPRIFVFLRQQWETYGNKKQLDELLTDSLILFALEGTDPEKGILLGRDDIYSKISGLVKYSPKKIEEILDKRLSALSKKPRVINHHRKNDKFCLPYETRLEIEEKNIADVALHEKFMLSVEVRIQDILKTTKTLVKDAKVLVCSTFKELFRQQGLEFADFVIKAENNNAIEKNLYDIISNVVESSSIIPKNRQIAKDALHATIRQIIYTGNECENEYLKKLSHSYMMLFLMQCDPHIATYFSTMASKLEVFVCTSLLVPALSEYHLEPRNRRHWNLLVNAHKAGVKLYVTPSIISELASHFIMADQEYKHNYKGNESYYRDEASIQYVDQIMIRSYFYSYMQGHKGSWRCFLENFYTPYGDNREQELIDFLQKKFGIIYREDASMGVLISNDDYTTLTGTLKSYKPSEKQAQNDAKTILNVYTLREKNNEKGDCGIFGYRTWWLSKDTSTHKAVIQCFGHKYPTSCYIRPDFLYNYISLAPSRIETENLFNAVFPTVLGVSISHHVDEEIAYIVHNSIKEHSGKDPARVTAIINNMSNRIKIKAGKANTSELKHYLDEELAKVNGQVK